MVFHNLRIRIGIFPGWNHGTFRSRNRNSGSCLYTFFCMIKEPGITARTAKKARHMRVQIVFRVLVTESPLSRYPMIKIPELCPFLSFTAVASSDEDHTSEKAMFSPSEIVKLRYFTVSSTSFGVTNIL